MNLYERNVKIKAMNKLLFFDGNCVKSEIKCSACIFNIEMVKKYRCVAPIDNKEMIEKIKDWLNRFES
jgi:hypothetical protein